MNDTDFHNLPFGERIRKLRIEHGYTEQQLADRVGITLSAQSYRESRDSVPHIDIVRLYAAVFEKEIGEIAPEVFTILPKAGTFGKLVREMRLAAKMTQVELAYTSGVRVGTISLVERGKHIATFRTVVRLARALGKNLEDFVTDDLLEKV